MSDAANIKNLRRDLKWAREEQISLRKQRDKANDDARKYRAKLQRILTDAGEYNNLSSKYLAQLIGELL